MKYGIKFLKFGVVFAIGLIEIPIVFLLRKANVYLFFYPGAFGHQAGNIEHIAREARAKGGNPTLVSFMKSQYIPNKALYEHHKNSGLIIVNNRFLTKILLCGFTVQKAFNKKGVIVNAFANIGSMENVALNFDIYTKSKVYFTFSENENKKIDSVLLKMSLTDNEFYVFQDRNIGYHNKLYKNYTNNNHDDAGRVESIEDFERASIEMKKIGIRAVRFGSNSARIKFDSTIIDYPNSYRSELGDFADLALMERCKFFVGPNSGLCAFARSLNKPMLYCNVYPWPWMHIPMRTNSLSMPKKIWMVDEKRMMTLREMINMEKEFYYKKLMYDEGFYKSMRIEIINNSSEEIMQSVIEINSRIDGTWDGVDYKLDSILKDNIGRNSQSVLSTAFADLNKDIMGDLYKG